MGSGFGIESLDWVALLDFTVMVIRGEQLLALQLNFAEIVHLFPKRPTIKNA